MRAYATIVKDSFHEALASKTMWVLLALATLFLAALAPVGIAERGPKRFEWGDFRDRDGLTREINRQAAEDTPSPGKRIVEVESHGDPPAADGDKGNDDNKSGSSDAKSIATVPATVPATAPAAASEKTSGPFPRSGDVRSALNEAVHSRELYDQRAWADYELGDEARGLIERGVDSLDDEEVERLNRLLIEAALGRFLNVAETRSYLGYAGWYMDESLGAGKAYLLARTLSLFTDYVLGGIGIMVALIVTSTFVPRTFETGAVDLLLSKPVSRSLVFLAKVTGGCAFVAVISAYVIGGLYLIAGLRLDYWNHQFLLCIPLLLFLFAIFYSVSALAGVLWRNAIVSVVVALVFWAACFAIGLTKEIFDAQVMMPRQVTRLVASDDQLFGSFAGSFGMGQSAFRRWDADAGAWIDTFVPAGNAELRSMPWENRFDAGPVVEPRTGRLFAVGNLTEIESSKTTGPWLLSCSADGGWQQRVLGRLPSVVRHLLVRADGKMLGLASSGIVEIPTDAKPLADAKLNGEKLNGEKLDNTEANVALAVEETQVADWAMPSAAAAHDATTDIAVYDPGRLRVLRLVDGKRYEVRVQYDVAPQAACDGEGLAFVADRLVLGLFDGRILVFAVRDEKLELLAEHPQVDNTAIKQIVLAPDGKSFAARRDDQRVFWYDCAAGGDAEGEPLAASAQGDVTAIAMTGDGELAAAYAYNHVVRFDAERRIASKLAPQYSGVESVYWYGIVPVYTIFPKPGELGNLTKYLLYGKETVRSGDGPGAIEQKLDIYTPIWSNVAFLSVVLAIGCWYVSRRDF
ncbi:MAG: ABC transporter permease [Pirellulales bacterium]